MSEKYKPSEKDIEMFKKMTADKSIKELLKMLKNVIHAYNVIKHHEKGE